MSTRSTSIDPEIFPQLESYLLRVIGIHSFIRERIRSLHGVFTDEPRLMPTVTEDRVSQGVALRYKNGLPESLGTVFGKIVLLEKCMPPDREALQGILSQSLGLIQIQPQVHSWNQPQGPVFAITKDSQGIPFPPVDAKEILSVPTFCDISEKDQDKLEGLARHILKMKR